MKAFSKKILIGAMILLCVLILYTFLTPKLSFENLQLYKKNLQALVQKNYIFAVFAYIVCYILVAALLLPAASLLTLTGGLLFGVIPGALYTVIGATAGATLLFMLVRYLFKVPFERSYHQKLITFNKEIKQHGAYYLLSLRLFVFFPFFLVNILAALTSISLSTFIITTAIGIIPGTVVYTFAGQQLSTVASMRDILSPGIIAAFLLLALLALIPIFLKKDTK